MRAITKTIAAIVFSVSGLSLGSSAQADSFSISISDASTSFSFSVYDDDYYEEYYEVPVYIVREHGWRPRVYSHHHHRHHKPDKHYRKYGHHKPDKHYRKHGHHKPDKHDRKHGYHKPDKHGRKHGHPGYHRGRAGQPRRDGPAQRPGRTHLTRVVQPAGA